jgi:hypothetical protein
MNRLDNIELDDSAPGCFFGAESLWSRIVSKSGSSATWEACDVVQKKTLALTLGECMSWKSGCANADESAIHK